MRGADDVAPGLQDDEGLRERSLGELFGKLSTELTTLIRQELELARAELTQKGKQVGKGAGLLGGGGVIALLAGGALTAAIIAALDLAMATWLAALIVAVVYGAVAAVLALQGKARVQEATPPVPEQTVDTVKEDVAWAKTRARSAK
jgi:Putative Actinobacterial Holin-X, holin superfamily III